MCPFLKIAKNTVAGVRPVQIIAGVMPVRIMAGVWPVRIREVVRPVRGSIKTDPHKACNPQRLRGPALQTIPCLAKGGLTHFNYIIIQHILLIQCQH